MAQPGPDPNWRDARAYRPLLEVDRAAIMWEWLRRDPDYIAWHARASIVTGATAGGLHPDEDPMQWGLHFRRASGCRGTGGPVDLACRL